MHIAQGDCRGNRRCYDRRDSRPVYTLQAIIAATNTCLIEQPTGDCRRDDRPIATTTGCGDDHPVYTPYLNLSSTLLVLEGTRVPLDSMLQVVGIEMTNVRILWLPMVRICTFCIVDISVIL